MLANPWLTSRFCWEGHDPDSLNGREIVWWLSHRWNFLEVWPLELFSCHFKLNWCLPKVSQYKTTRVKVLTVGSSCCCATQEWGTGEVEHTEVSSLVLEQLSVVTGTRCWRSHMLWNLETKPAFPTRSCQCPPPMKFTIVQAGKRYIQRAKVYFQNKWGRNLDLKANEVNISSSHIFFLKPSLSFSCTVAVLYERVVKRAGKSIV